LLRSAPSEVFSPFSVYQSRGATYPGEYLTHPVTFCALGFLTPSTRCSPHDLPGLFHPGSAHGVNPSRLYSFQRCRTAFSAAAALLELVRVTRSTRPSCRVYFTVEVPLGGLGFSQANPTDASLGFFLYEVSCFLRCSPPVWRRPSPLAFSRTDLHARQPADATGF